MACQDTKKCAVIDPGADKKSIMEYIKKNNLIIEYILATHFHQDHTAFAESVRQETGARLAMHEDDIPYYGKDVDIILHDGDTIEIGNTVKLKVIHAPGHTPGGVCFYGDGKLFTGDTLFVGDSGRTDLPYSNRQMLGASIRKLMKLPEDTIVLPGHDYGETPTSTLAYEKRHNVNAKEYGFYVPD
ncbi:MAG: MBL fold metallo-hydrolase [Deferribacterota bacterium]|nr:MBL fold metallo-hydrolase [Deferribacterota bacterium]